MAAFFLLISWAKTDVNRKKNSIFTTETKIKNMVYKFTLISDEVDDFVRVISIDSEATFFDLHNAILESVKYDKNQMTSFFICSDDWEKGQEVTLIEMDSSSEYDNLIMEDTPLEELLVDEKQKLLYVFDLISDRAFFIELTEIIPRKDLKIPLCLSSKGKAPEQIISEEAVDLSHKITIDENFYGDQEFNADELDEEGYGDLNFDDSALFSEDPKL